MTHATWTDGDETRYRACATPQEVARLERVGLLMDEAFEVWARMDIEDPLACQLVTLATGFALDESATQEQQRILELERTIDVARMQDLL